MVFMDWSLILKDSENQLSMHAFVLGPLTPYHALVLKPLALDLIK